LHRLYLLIFELVLSSCTISCASLFHWPHLLFAEDSAFSICLGYATRLAGSSLRAAARNGGVEWPTLPDPKDRWVLDLAHASGADCVVTRDRHFLDRAGELEALGFRVLTPRRILGLLRA